MAPLWGWNYVALMGL